MAGTSWDEGGGERQEGREQGQNQEMSGGHIPALFEDRLEQLMATPLCSDLSPSRPIEAAAGWRLPYTGVWEKPSLSRVEQQQPPTCSVFSAGRTFLPTPVQVKTALPETDIL